jgi:molecular chaperone HscB
MNYFELFEIPVQLKVDAASLKKKFYELSRKYHPDFFSQSTEAEQGNALEMASMLNKAWKTFQQPDETIKYVLQLKGLLEEEEKYELAPDFLMEMLELNEELMETDTDEKSLSALDKRIAQIQEDMYEPVKPIVEHYKEGVSTEKELLQVKQYYFRKKYLWRILDKMDAMRNIATRLQR